MSEAARSAVIHEHLQTLKLPAFRRSYETLARRANDGGWAYEDYLRELLEAEVLSRRERAAADRLREAHLL
jgi:DNA replication protein DnaC